MLENPPRIKVGDYIVIQRQKYIKLHKFNSLDSTAALGNEQLILRNIEDQLYYSTFKMIPEPKGKKGGAGGNKRLNTLEICSEIEMVNIREILNNQESGEDNRNIVDNGDSQSLKAEDIDKLKDSCTGSTQIIEKIVENSKSFNSKTEYAQEKYLKKKEKKYFEYVQIRQPTLRLLSEIFYRLDPDKIMGIRFDTLSQIISYSGLSGFGKFLLYESGTNGLLPAAFLNSMGAGTEAQMVHMHPGNFCQKQAILALNLPEEQKNRCIPVNIYSVIREFYQGDDNNIVSDDSKRKHEDTVDDEPKSKVIKLDDSVNSVETTDKVKEIVNEQDQPLQKPRQTQQWEIENRKACQLMREKFDCLVIAAKEHPSNLLKALLPFIKPSRPVVIFSLSKEILMELYVDLKSGKEVTGLHLTSNWLRLLQILPNRTHPEVNMNGNSGYLLHGYTIQGKTQ